MTPRRAILALTMGEPAGIGGEVALGAWLRRDDPVEPVGPFVAIDDPRRLAGIAAALGWTVPVEAVPCVAAAADVFHRALPVL
ncbi:MAG: 4-hydroxythreonine-4-phosphate dehydrogenase, partial [Lysobacterales bacterium]